MKLVSYSSILSSINFYVAMSMAVSEKFAVYTFCRTVQTKESCVSDNTTKARHTSGLYLRHNVYPIIAKYKSSSFSFTLLYVKYQRKIVS